MSTEKWKENMEHMECKWYEKSWYKNLFFKMFVSKISQQTKEEVTALLNDMDAEDAQIYAEAWNGIFDRRGIVVEEEFRHHVFNGHSARGRLMGLLRIRQFSWKSIEKATDLLGQLSTDEEKERMAGDEVDILKSAADEESFQKSLEGIDPTMYVIDQADSLPEETHAMAPELEKIFKMAQKLKKDMLEVTVRLKDGSAYEGRFLSTILPSVDNEYKGVIYFRTYTYKTLRLHPADIRMIDGNEKCDSRFEIYSRLGEFYDAVERSGCIGKRITNIQNLGDDDFLIATNFCNLDQEKECFMNTEGPMVVKFEDGSNLALIIFTASTYGIQTNFNGVYEGEGKPNIDASILFKPVIGKRIVKFKAQGSNFYMDDMKVPYSAMDYPDDLLREGIFYMEDGTVFKFTEWGNYSYDTADGERITIPLNDWKKACGIPLEDKEEYCQEEAISSGNPEDLPDTIKALIPKWRKQAVTALNSNYGFCPIKYARTSFRYQRREYSVGTEILSGIGNEYTRDWIFEMINNQIEKDLSVRGAVNITYHGELD